MHDIGFLFIYLAASGVSFRTRDLCCLTQDLYFLNTVLVAPGNVGF